MVLTIKTHIWFDEWIGSLADPVTRRKIAARLLRFEQGNFGDFTSVGHGVSELRLHFGPEYRIYFMRHGQTVYVMIGGGDKSTQARDIQRAITIAAELKDSET